MDKIIRQGDITGFDDAEIIDVISDENNELKVINKLMQGYEDEILEHKFKSIEGYHG